MQGWEIFARQIIKELAKYDKEHKTFYAYYLDEQGGEKVLADVMSRVDKKNQWEPIKVQAND
jgi:hypothetical protein